MNINFTVFVQLIHFLVAYVILEKFLIRPAYKSLLEKNNQATQLHTQIASLKNELHAQEQTKQDLWIEAQKKFASTIPNLRSETTKYIIHGPAVTLLPQEQHAYQQELETRLIQRLKNVSH